MKKSILFLFGFLLSLTMFAQNDGVTGVVKFDNIAAMEAVTPDTTNSHAVIGLVKSKNELYHFKNGAWNLLGGAPFTVDNTGNSVELDFTGGVLTAIISQQGATEGQYLYWNNTAGEWQPKSLTAADVGITDAGSHYTATNVETALTELGVIINDIYTLAGVAEGSTDLGTFTGVTISDGNNIKGALQELETAVESSIMVTGTYDSDAAAGVGSVPIGGHYYLSATNVYGGTENTIRRRKN